jgi:hypothetical protein
MVRIAKVCTPQIMALHAACFVVVSRLAYYLTLKMEVTCSSETSCTYLLSENSKMPLGPKRLIAHFNNLELLQIYSLVRKIGVVTDPEVIRKIVVLNLGIATVCGLDGRGSIRGSERDVSLFHSIHTASGTHQGSYPVGTGAPFPRG